MQASGKTHSGYIQLLHNPLRPWRPALEVRASVCSDHTVPQVRRRPRALPLSTLLRRHSRRELAKMGVRLGAVLQAGAGEGGALPAPRPRGRDRGPEDGCGTGQSSAAVAAPQAAASAWASSQQSARPPASPRPRRGPWSLQQAWVSQETPMGAPQGRQALLQPSAARRQRRALAQRTAAARRCRPLLTVPTPSPPLSSPSSWVTSSPTFCVC